ncbi:MAG TPA: hypothetical protein VKZ50_04495 [bacterium]|nr:hypothetical protein [bacterium]
METLYVALDNFSYVFGDHGRVRSFKAGEVLSDSLVALFGTATVPVVKQSEQDCYWWCSACRSLHDLDPETCTVDHRTPIWRVPAPIRCAIPTGGVRSYEMGQHIFDPLDVQALRGTNVPVEAVEDAALCALVCNNCGARYRRVIAAGYPVEEARRLRARDQRDAQLLEDAAIIEREHARRAAAKKERSYARIAALKAKMAQEER